MKNILILTAFMTTSLLATAQTKPTSNSKALSNSKTEITVKSVSTTLLKVKTSLCTNTKSKLTDINQNKSLELISIKAYKKSLHIRVKAIRLC